ncbi:MAG: hypothetical protein MJZ61_07825 [Bacteroidales bacterium]|nr:hypothetical protein [Bacteroidales bacterium]
MRMFRLILLLIISLSSLFASAQCKQRFVYECALQNPGLIFLKEFNTKFSSGKIQKHKVILNKGYMYTLQLCNPSDEQYLEGNAAKSTGLAINSMLSLYDNNNNILATTNQNFKFTFYCPKTDVYWIHIMPLSPKTTCAVGILSVMKR